MDFFNQKNIIHKQQHGFTKGLSTITALNELIHEIIEKMESNLKIGTVIFDLSKAFDCVDHNILMHKLKKYGLRGIGKNLIKTYLVGRKQLTEIYYKADNKINKIQSKYKIVNYGVPQGTVVGPLSFILYVNDICQTSKTKVVSYADDTTLLCWGDKTNTLKINMQHAINNLIDFFNSNNLTCNINKTKIMTFFLGNKSLQENFQLQIEKSDTEEVDDYKFLGIHVDSRLMWDKHIDTLCSNVSKSIYLLRYFKPLLGEKYLKLIYYGVIYPHMLYGIEIWGGAAEVHMKRLFVLQKRCIRIMYDLTPRESCKETFTKNNMLTLYSLYAYRVILFIKDKQLSKNNDMHSYNTRNKTDYHKSTNAKKVSDKDANVMGIKLYNKLPTTLKILNGTIFKRQLKKFLISTCLYNLNEL